MSRAGSNPSAFGAARAPVDQFRVGKRSRTMLSCGPCRRRKQKCDRVLPCNNCIKRGDHDVCTYTFPDLHKKNEAVRLGAATKEIQNNTQANSANKIPSEVQSRIDRLEGLVLSLVQKGGPPKDTDVRMTSLAETEQLIKEKACELPIVDEDQLKKDEAESDLDRITKSVGSMMLIDDSAIFVSSTHWYIILAELREVKRWFNNHGDQYEDIKTRLLAEDPDNGPVGNGSFFLQAGTASGAEIFWEFPTKATCDILLARFFAPGTLDPAYSRLIL